MATGAMRDEGTSHHYLAPDAEIDAPAGVARSLEKELLKRPLRVLPGTVWTTDAPYRETREQLAAHASSGVLAVEMQTASLFAFSKARRFPVGLVAYVTNGPGEAGEVDKGSRELEFEVLRCMCRAGTRYLGHARRTSRR